MFVLQVEGSQLVCEHIRHWDYKWFDLIQGEHLLRGCSPHTVNPTVSSVPRGSWSILCFRKSTLSPMLMPCGWHYLGLVPHSRDKSSTCLPALPLYAMCSCWCDGAYLLCSRRFKPWWQWELCLLNFFIIIIMIMFAKASKETSHTHLRFSTAHPGVFHVHCQRHVSDMLFTLIWGIRHCLVSLPDQKT